MVVLQAEKGPTAKKAKGPEPAPGEAKPAATSAAKPAAKPEAKPETKAAAKTPAAPAKKVLFLPLPCMPALCSRHKPATVSVTPSPEV